MWCPYAADGREVKCVLDFSMALDNLEWWDRPLKDDNETEQTPGRLLPEKSVVRAEGLEPSWAV